MSTVPGGLARWYSEHIQCQDNAFSRMVRRCVILPYLKFACGRGTGFYRTEVVPELEELGPHLEEIRDECRKLWREGGLRVFRELLINPQRGWKQFSFFRRGRPEVTQAAKERLPATTGAFARYFSGLDINVAAVSVLEPGGRILPHADVGIDPRFLRFHFGVDIPSPCGIRCAGESTTWPEGAWIALDERKLHSCFNDGDRPRIILAMDLAVPAELRVPARDEALGAG